MARFDVYANPEGIGFLLDIQADLLAGLNTRVVVPLLPLSQAPHPAQRLNPVFTVAQTDVVMVTQFLAAVPKNMLGAPILSLEAQRTEIVNATDMLLQGF